MTARPVSVILATGARYILPLLLLFAVFILLRGHNLPGGGFIAGLIVACGFALFALAYSVKDARHILRADPLAFISTGLILAFVSGMLSLLIGQPYMTGLWIPFELPALGKVGTPVMFDMGVFLVVIGVVLTIVFNLAEDQT